MDSFSLDTVDRYYLLNTTSTSSRTYSDQRQQDLYPASLLLRLTDCDMHTMPCLVQENISILPAPHQYHHTNTSNRITSPTNASGMYKQKRKCKSTSESIISHYVAGAIVSDFLVSLCTSLFRTSVVAYLRTLQNSTWLLDMIRGFDQYQYRCQ